MNWTTVVGILLGTGAIALGHWIEGGQLASMLQPAAALIVFGGTAGATVLSFPASDLRRAGRLVRRVLTAETARERRVRARLVEMAGIVRKEGVIALEASLQRETDPGLAHAMRHLVDGTSAQVLREILDTELSVRVEQDLAAARVFEAAGGFAPTLGILGAVLGLIQVMQNLDEPGRLGAGIAVAFVATVYGVGLANLVCLPIARRLRRAVERERLLHEMTLEGALGIHAGQSPAAVAERLRPYLGDATASGKPAR